jgi:hypothetical protein
MVDSCTIVLVVASPLFLLEFLFEFFRIEFPPNFHQEKPRKMGTVSDKEMKDDENEVEVTEISPNFPSLPRDEKRNLRFPCVQWKRKRNFVSVSTVYKGNANFVFRPCHCHKTKQKQLMEITRERHIAMQTF